MPIVIYCKVLLTLLLTLGSQPSALARSSSTEVRVQSIPHALGSHTLLGEVLFCEIVEHDEHKGEDALPAPEAQSVFSVDALYVDISALLSRTFKLQWFTPSARPFDVTVDTGLARGPPSALS